MTMLSIIAISVSMRDLPAPIDNSRRRLQIDSTEDVDSVSSIADLKKYLLNRLDLYKNTTTSQEIKSQIMRSINLLMKSPEIQSAIDHKNIAGLYGTFSPFIS
jgi:hypothetical protein